MNCVTLSVASRDEVDRRVLAAFQGEAQGSHISFASIDLFRQTLTERRWDILWAMTGAGGLSIRALARRVHRDAKGVQGDVAALLLAGVIDRDRAGVVFRYDAVRVDVLMKATDPGVT